jgi:hypothetical protein
MMNKRARIDASQDMVKNIQGRLLSWLERRRKDDAQQRYFTLLKRIETILTVNLKEFDRVLDGVSLQLPFNDLYSECRKIEQSALWLCRIWDHYRDKLDQRDDRDLRPILLAADEIVWNCHRRVFENLSELPPGVTPLPYLDYFYSPEALTRGKPFPRELLPEKGVSVKSDLEQRLDNLPIPLVSMPINCLHAPWWLIYLGHETGHHIQYDTGAQDSFGVGLKAYLARQAGLDQKAVNRWHAWSFEVFADTFSVFNMGQWAARALAELVLARRDDLLDSTQLAYPPALVRIRLLSLLLQTLDVPDALEETDPGKWVNTMGDALSPEIAAHLQIAAAAVDYLVQYPINGRSLLSLCDWDKKHFREHGAVDVWAARLAGEEELSPIDARGRARLICSGGLLAWTRAASAADRAAAQEHLRARMLQALAISHEEGARGADEEAQIDVEQVGHDLAAWLLQAAPPAVFNE